MRTTHVAAVLMLAGIGSAASAAEFIDTAEVIAANPIYETVNEPRRECRTEYISETVSAPRPERRSYLGTIIGGVAGGLLGAQIGDGNGRTAAAATGAVIGALVGDNMSNNRNEYAETTTRSRPVERCYNVDNTRKQVKGYDVTYRYNDRVGSVILPYNPGRTVRIGVGVVEEGGGANRIVPIDYDRSRRIDDAPRDDRRGQARGHHFDKKNRYESPYKYKHTEYIPPGG